MNAAGVSKFLGYSVSAVTTSLGILVLFGLIVTDSIPTQFRIIFGVVLLLMGVYRFVTTKTRTMQTRREDE
jgi:predicted metal-binding membrane protein